MTITLENECKGTFEFPYEDVAEQVVEAVLDSEEFPFEAEVNLLLVDAASIQEINVQQRDLDQVTDVLSFPLIDYPEPGDFSRVEESEDNFNPDTGEAMLGDIILCVDRVKLQAEEYGHSEKREYAFLIAHSMFHLLGYDHMTPEEAQVMEAKQRQILGHLGISR